jgi:hypothetical protein
MPTQALSRTFAAQSFRSIRTSRSISRVPGLTAGQCFDIDITPEISGWIIRIPEINGETHASRRAAVEVVARKYIAARTGIPIGYITVNVRD